jgi:RNA polymerase sigma-70 factor (ECF subfamily)
VSLPLTLSGFTPPWRVLATSAASAPGVKGPGPTAPAERDCVETEQPPPQPQQQTAAGATTGAATTATGSPGSDLALIRAAAAGDRGAFHALVDRHSPGLFRVARSLSRNRADAEDVLQETFVGAFRGLKNFDGRASVKTWLTRICVRLAARHWHGSRRSREAMALDAPGAADAVSASDQALSTASAVPHVDRRLDLGAVIGTLADDHREVIVLREVRGLSYDEIAAALNVPRGTVESRLHRARAALRQKLNGYGAG